MSTQPVGVEVAVEFTAPLARGFGGTVSLMHDVRADGFLPVTVNGNEVGRIPAMVDGQKLDVSTWGVASWLEKDEGAVLLQVAPFPADSCGCLRDFTGNRRRPCGTHAPLRDGTMHNQIAEDDGYPVVRDWGRT